MTRKIPEVTEETLLEALEISRKRLKLAAEVEQDKKFIDSETTAITKVILILEDRLNKKRSNLDDSSTSDVVWKL